MTLLSILTLLNLVFVSIFFLTGRSIRMTYTEVMVARKIGAYILTLLTLVIICLILLKATLAVQVIAFTVNIILAVTLLAYFISKMIR